MALPTSMTDLTSLFSLLAHKRVAQLVMAVLLIYIANIFANITWSVVPQAQSSYNTAIKGGAQGYKNDRTNQTIDITKIQSLNLFGQSDEAAVEEPEIEVANVPETKLNLILSGLVASDDKSTSAAIIEYQGKQETYGVGDVILGTRANLEQVLMDRVLIKQSGRLETLMLDGFDYSQPAQKISTQGSSQNTGAQFNDSGVVDQRDNKALTASAKNLRQELANDPAKISDYLRISPKRNDGKIIGYTLRPGKKPEFFKLSGLKAGDVAVEMNGYDFNRT